jgi:ribosomal protein S17
MNTRLKPKWVRMDIKDHIVYRFQYDDILVGRLVRKKRHSSYTIEVMGVNMARSYGKLSVAQSKAELHILENMRAFMGNSVQKELDYGDQATTGIS